MNTPSSPNKNTSSGGRAAIARRAGRCYENRIPSAGPRKNLPAARYLKNMTQKTRRNSSPNGKPGTVRRYLVPALIAFAAGLSGVFLVSRRAAEPKARTGAAESWGDLAADPEVVRGEEALQAGEIVEALRCFESVARRHPKRYEAFLALSEFYRSLGEFTPAIEAARRACELGPRESKCFLALGLSLEAAGENDRAARAYDRAHRLDPKDPVPLFRLGFLEERRAHSEVAVRYYRRALALDPTYAPAAHYLAGQLMDAGKFAEAERLLAAALRRDPGNTSLRLDLAHVYLRQGDASRAAELFARLVPEVPQMAEPAYHLGCALVLLGKDPEAEKAFLEALRRDPHFSSAWYALHQLRRRRGDEKAAAEALSRFETCRKLDDRINALRGLLSKNPRDVRALVELGAALLTHGKTREALRRLSQALDLDPKNARARSLWEKAARAAANPRRNMQSRVSRGRN